MTKLPDGFILDEDRAASAGLPPGFVLDEGPGQAASAPKPDDKSVFKNATTEKSVGGFIGNIGRDANDIASSIYRGVVDAGHKVATDPVGAGRNVLDAVDTAGAVISGGLGHAYNDAVSAPVLTVNNKEVIPAIGKEFAMTPGNDMNLASKVGGYLKDRYWGWDNLGNTLYEHPVQSAMDASSLFYGGQAALPKAMAGAKSVLGTAAELTNPLNVVAKPFSAARSAMAGRGALKEMRDTAPSLNQVIGRKNQLYNTLDNAGIKFDANAYGQMLGSLSNKLRTFRATRAPMTADAVKNMMTFNGKSPSFRDVEEMLIEAKGILREPGASNADKAAANIMLDEVDSFFNGAPVMTNGSISAADIVPMTREARDLARRHIIAREAAEIERKSKWYSSGDESGIRNQFASFGKRQGKSLTPLEEKAAKKVVRREGVHGLLNTAGSKLTQAMVLGGLGIGAGLPAAIAGGAISLGSRAASAAMTNAKADQFLKTVLAGKDAQNAAMAAGSRIPISAKKPLLLGEIARLLAERQ